MFGSFMFAEAYWAQPPRFQRAVHMICASITLTARIVMNAITLTPRVDGHPNIQQC